MRQAILDQLKKCQWADVSKFDKETGTCFIPKYKKPEYKVNCCYLISVPENELNNHTSILATNWNHGDAPTYKTYKAFVSKLLGKMIFVDAMAYDVDTQEDLQIMFSGWLDAETLTLISVL